ncbi:MAG: hypothetical protein PUK16_06650 [Prevotellaceae bacterium]|nr:hypothetical protein [Prevotellaceae bacterium]MDY2633510.1 hypothetical protein [Prevotella sp.]
MNTIQPILFFIIILSLTLYVLHVRSEAFRRWVGRLLRKFHAEPVAALTRDEVIGKLNEALRQLNCRPQWTREGSHSYAVYQFQTGHFHLRVDETPSVVRLSFFNCFETGLDNIHYVRTLCNQAGLNSSNERIVYTLDDKEQNINIHILSQVSVHEPQMADALQHRMQDIFVWQATFVNHFREMVESDEDTYLKDRELGTSQITHELYLMREQELLHQEVGNIRETPSEGLTVARWAELALQSPAFTPVGLTFSDPAIAPLHDKAAIAGYRLADALVGEGRFRREEVTLVLSYYDSRHPEEKQKAVLYLHAQNGDGQTLYYRITSMTVPGGEDIVAGITGTGRSPRVRWMLAAVDLTTDKHRHDEFVYMWKEAQEKLRNGEESSLTDDQKLIARFADVSVAGYLYRGHKLFLNRRYAEAVPFLDAAFRQLHPRYHKLKAAQKEQFMNVCYYIGFCYMQLEDYTRAYYYLDILSGSNRILFAQELVNCLVNAGDLRALNYINGLIEQIDLRHDDDDDDDEPDDRYTDFYHFLERRKAYVLIELSRFDEAKELLQRMLDEPANSDFAIRELAYLQNIEEAMPPEAS